MQYSKIGLDLDDTVADHSQNFLKIFKKHRWNIPLEEGIKREARKRYLSDEQYRQMQSELYGKLNREAIPMEGSKKNNSETFRRGK